MSAFGTGRSAAVRHREASAVRPSPSKGPARMVAANSVGRALAQIGDRWSLLIIGAAFAGAHRFTDWREDIGIASNILADRLRHLQRIGCLERSAGKSGKRPAYHLTDKGRDLYPVALMFWRFDRAWSSRCPAGTETLVHATCGQPTTPKLVCGHCRATVNGRNVAYVDGPGACMEKAPRPPASRRSRSPPRAGSAGNGLFGESIEIFGDRWTQHIIGMFFLGGPRFEDIRARLPIATNILSDRLKLLVAHGILQRRVYQIKPERGEYLLTPKGMDVYPIMAMLNKWGDRWLAPDGRPPLLLFHRPCNHRLDPIVVCCHCDAPLDCRQVSLVGRRAAGSGT